MSSIFSGLYDEAHSYLAIIGNVLLDCRMLPRITQAGRRQKRSSASLNKLGGKIRCKEEVSTS